MRGRWHKTRARGPAAEQPSPPPPSHANPLLRLESKVSCNLGHPLEFPSQVNSRQAFPWKSQATELSTALTSCLKTGPGPLLP